MGMWNHTVLATAVVDVCEAGEACLAPTYTSTAISTHQHLVIA